MVGSEEKARKAQYERILKDTESMSQEERWAYYDAHPGFQEIVWEFKHRNFILEGLRDLEKSRGEVVARELSSIDRAIEALGLRETVDAIDRATEGLSSDEYVQWLEDHPSAKQALIKVNELRDSNFQQ